MAPRKIVIGYTEKQLLSAAEVKNNTLSQRKAAKKHGVINKYII